MAPTREERIELLKKKKEELDRKLKAEKALASKEERKKRTRELIELGGLVRIAFPEGTAIDKGYLLGALLWSAKAAATPDKANMVSDFKRVGDAEIAKREAEKAARKGGKNETV